MPILQFVRCGGGGDVSDDWTGGIPEHRWPGISQLPEVSDSLNGLWTILLLFMLDCFDAAVTFLLQRGIISMPGSCLS
jgi:hypothetical protein